MAFRIATSLNREPVKAVKRPAYLEWLRELPCIVTGMIGVEAAHVSTASPIHGHYGRGKGQKASDRWCLPLCPVEHRKQHGMNETAYWASVGINPHLACLILWGVYSDGGDPMDAAAIMQKIRFGVVQ